MMIITGSSLVNIIAHLVLRIDFVVVGRIGGQLIGGEYDFLSLRLGKLAAQTDPVDFGLIAAHRFRKVQRKIVDTGKFDDLHRILDGARTVHH